MEGGPRCDPAEYRSFTLTSHILKTIERGKLEENNLMDRTQHGSRAGRSTLTQLLAQHEIIIELISKGLNIDIIYLDFCKAFDRVDHAMLLSKIIYLRIGGKLIQWVRDFLTRRTQKVRVDGELPEPEPVVSGVP